MKRNETKRNETKRNETRPDQTRPDQTRPNQTRPNQTKPNQTKHQTKLGKALVDVGKVSWPQEDSDFLTEILQLARWRSFCALVSLLTQASVDPYVQAYYVRLRRQ